MSTRPTIITACAMVLGVTAGCGVNGPTYPEVIGHETALAPEQVRIVFLRPDDRYDDYSGSEAVIRVNDDQLGELGYGGFLYTDVPAGDVNIETGTSNPLRLPWIRSCRLQLELNAGSTVFYDVQPRPANVAIGVLSAIVGFGLIGAGPTTYGVGEMGEMFVDDMAQTATQAAATQAAQSAESAGKICGGPFQFANVDRERALQKLESLSWSR